MHSLKIKLKRIGTKSHPVFNLILMKTLKKTNGQFIKKLGFYDTIKKQLNVNIKNILYYLKAGAYPTKTVRNLLLKLIY